jgi:restriction system protein
MTVPDFQSWFLPLLRRIADGQVHAMPDVMQALADDLGLAPEDRSEVLPSGRQLKYKNRIGWARTYLKKAGLVEAPAEGMVRITDRGREVLAENPPKLNVAFLKRFPEFLEFHTYRAPDSEVTAPNVITEEEQAETPEETLERVHSALEEELASDLLDRIKAVAPAFFERLVIDLLLRMGYGGSHEAAGRAIGRSGDGGVDGIINEDPLGLDVVYIQAKRWEGSVGRPVVQAFVGSLAGFRATKGVLITTSGFSNDARAYVTSIGTRVILIDGAELTRLMLKYGLAVTTKATYELRRIDNDYFEA